MSKKMHFKTIKEGIYHLFNTKGVENVTNDECLRIAKSVKSDTKWNIYHLYYWRKRFRQEAKVRKSLLKSKKTLLKRKVKKEKKAQKETIS